MSKAQKMTAIVTAKPAVIAAMKNVYVVEKASDGKYSMTFTSAFREKAVGAASGLDKLITDYTPLAINLWAAYKYATQDKGGPLLGSLQFFHAIDSTIPEQHGKVGSPQRKLVTSHKVLNRLQYLTLKVGRTAAGDNPVPPTPEDRATKAAAELSAFKRWAKKYKLEPLALRDLLTMILKKADKAGKLNKTGNEWYRAVAPSAETDSE